MKLAICAGPATSGKTSVLRHVVRKLRAGSADVPPAGSPLKTGTGTGPASDQAACESVGPGASPHFQRTAKNVAFLKIDVQFAEEDQEFAREFDIPTKKVYSGELCPDHCSVMVLGEALQWAGSHGADVLLVETAGLCLRCSPYVDGGLGLVVLEATSGMNLPRKIGPMLSLADVAVVTKIDLVSQAEREVFRARILDAAPGVRVREVNALYGIGIDPLVERILATEDVTGELLLRGNPPVGTCTICVGKKTVGWQAHFGVVRPLENQTFYRGE